MAIDDVVLIALDGPVLKLAAITLRFSSFGRIYEARRAADFRRLATARSLSKSNASGNGHVGERRIYWKYGERVKAMKFA